MNVLFLGINASIKGPRDGITYPFIVKEMKALIERGVDVYFLARHIDENVEIDGVKYLAMDKLLEHSRPARLIAALRYLARHFRPLIRLVWCDANRTKNVIAAEICIARSIVRYKIDLVHTHFLWPSGEAGVLSARSAAVPVVATLRGAELVDRPEFDYGAMNNDFNRLAAKIAFPRISHFTAPSQYLTDMLAQDFAVPQARTSYLPNGVEKIEAPAEVERQPGPLRLLSIGRLVKRKNIEILIETAAASRDLDYEIVVIGEGKLQQELQGAIDELGLKNLRLHPEIDKQTLYRMILASDCVVHPAFFEGMPNVVLESFALGRPCLASDIPVHRELVAEGVNGWLFDPTSSTALIERIRHLISRRDELAKMYSACRSTAGEFTLERKIDGYGDIYARLLNR